MKFSPADFEILQTNKKLDERRKQANKHFYSSKLVALKNKIKQPFVFKKTHFAVLTLGLFLINGLAGFMFFQQAGDVMTQARAGEVLGVSSTPKFNPNNVISNADFRSFRVFGSAKKIQTFLESVRSPLANYSQNGQSASEIIWKASIGETSSKYGYTPKINPALILTYLEKEQSLVSDKKYDPYTTGAKRMKKAAGYGCPDDKNCDKDYKGFANQVNWLAYQLERNFVLATNEKNSYSLGKQVTTLDKKTVTISNAATSAVYRYTPHVYWSAYNTWKLMTLNNWMDKADKTYGSKELDNVNLQDDIKTYATYKTKVAYDIPKVKELLKKDWQLGDRSPEISQMQSYLLDTGHYDYDEITGVYGPISQRAVASYVSTIRTQEGLKNQSKKEIEAQTNKAPEEIVKDKGNQECLNLYNQKYKIGQKDETVAKLQTCLKSVGMFGHPKITGKYGKITNRGLSKILKNPTLMTTSSPQ